MHSLHKVYETNALCGNGIPVSAHYILKLLNSFQWIWYWGL